MFYRNPDENLRQLEQDYALNGDVETLNKINAIRYRTGQEPIFSRKQVLENQWREIDSDIFQFANQLWNTYSIGEAIFQHLCLENQLNPDNYDPDDADFAEIRQEASDIEDRWRALLSRRSDAFNQYLNHLMGRETKRRFR